MLKRTQLIKKLKYSKALSGFSQYQVVMPMIRAINSVTSHIMAFAHPSLASSIDLAGSKKKFLGHFHGVKLHAHYQKTMRNSAWPKHYLKKQGLYHSSIDGDGDKLFRRLRIKKYL